MQGMAAKAAISEDTASASKVKLPVAMLLVVVILGAGLGCGAAGAGLYYLIKSGKLPLGAVATGADGAGASGAAGEGTAHQVVLEPILVNLADQGGHAYLRLGLTLDIEGDLGSGEAASDAKSGKAPSEQALAVRDTVLGVLGQQTSAWLLGPDGKEHLKIELKEALAKNNPQLKVKDLFFTDFLVQI
jgi:flagellar FliL protein